MGWEEYAEPSCGVSVVEKGALPEGMDTNSRWNDGSCCLKKFLTEVQDLILHGVAALLQILTIGVIGSRKKGLLV